MATWDVFHSDRLEAERSLSTEAVKAALSKGDLVEDDLVRPAGTTRWARIGDAPEFIGVPLGSAVSPSPSPVEEIEDLEEDDHPEVDPSDLDAEPASPFVAFDRADLARVESEPETSFEFVPEPDFEVEFEELEHSSRARQASSVTALPVLPDDETEAPDLPELVEPEPEPEFEFEDHDEFDPQDEDEEAAEFTLSRNSAERVEELDLAAMVDVAFQLVLFFLVTATSVVFKTLEVPKPNEDKPPEAAAQARAKSVDELEKDYILVEVDAAGAIKVDRQPVGSDRAALMERLRVARETTSRKAMLLSADFATRHKNAVLAFDVASEIGLSIAIAQPTGKK